MNPFLRFGALVAMLALCAPTAPARAVDVVVDDTHDVYVISGGVILDGSYAQSEQAASCGTCQWRVVSVCPPAPLDLRAACSLFPCATTSTVAELWRADAATPPPAGDALWRYLGLICLPGPPASTSALAAGVHDVAVRGLPALRPFSQPAGTTLTGLPTLFGAGQPTLVLTEPVTVTGIAVRVLARPTWLWDFGHGPLLTTEDAGGPWPSGSIRHSYPRRGIYRIRVTSSWHATYQARGITGIPVDGVITQSTWFDLRVREARRFLRQPQGV